MKKLATILGVWALFAGFAMGQEGAANVPAAAVEPVQVQPATPAAAPEAVPTETPATAAGTQQEAAAASDAGNAEASGTPAAVKPEGAATVPAQETASAAPAATPVAATAAPAPAAEGQKAESLAVWEMIVFCLVVVGVIGLGIWKSGNKGESEEEKKEKGAADYFLAGRGLSWWLVGFSLLAANISTEQFVGMSGQAADWLGLAIAGYEWLAAIVLVIVAFSFLPMLLKRGVFTIPQFLEERFNGVSRVAMACVNLLILVGVPTAAVIYAGANVVAVYFDLTVPTGCIIIAVCATVYVYVGGLKACAWTDLIWGSALIIGGGVVAWFAINKLGGIPVDQTQAVLDTASVSSHATADQLANSGSSFCDGLSRLWTLNDGDAGSAVNGIGGKLHMMRPADDPVMPWTVYLLGLWIPNFFYWGLNQYIMQRTLASKSLEEGQLGIVFAAFLKLLIPFVVIIPGILAYNLYRDDLSSLADKNAKEIVEKAEKSGKEVIYEVNPSRLIRVDSREQAVAWLEQNVAKAGPVSEEFQQKKAAVLNAQGVEASAKAAQELCDYEHKVTKEIRKNEEKYTVTTSLAAYHYDSAFATLLKRLLPGTGWAWFVLAALFGAVVSSLASMLNSASTLFTMDIYGKAKQVMGKEASSDQLVAMGKWAVLAFALIATVLAPFLDNPAFGGIFTFIQEFQGFLSPGVLAVFLFGFFVPKCPRVFGWLGIVLGVVFFALLKWAILPDASFLNRMAISFVSVCLVGLVLTIVNHVKGGEAVILTDKGIIEMKTSPRAKIFGSAVIVLTIILYIIFW